MGASGKTAYEYIHGRRPHEQVVEFGEKIWWRPLQTEQNKLDPLGHRFEEWFLLGLLEGTTAVAVATLDGSIVQSRAIMRRTIDGKWDRDGLHKVRVWDIQPNVRTGVSTFAHRRIRKR